MPHVIPIAEMLRIMCDEPRVDAELVVVADPSGFDALIRKCAELDERANRAGE